jgi:protein-disulfide isomerase
MMRALLTGLALALGLFASPPAMAQTALSPAQKEEVRKLVREYIQQNPAIVQEALDELERRKQAALRKQIESDARDFSIGPRNAPVTIVEFYDYRCPYCHQAMEWVFEAIRRNPQKVRVIFKEFPVLGPASAEASQAAIAAIRQGRYLPFHQALMSHRGNLEGPQIDALARRSGIDVARMRRDMNDPAIFEHLRDNHELAAEAGVEGTPAFIINGEWLRGWNKPDADRMLAEALRGRRR